MDFQIIWICITSLVGTHIPTRFSSLPEEFFFFSFFQRISDKTFRRDFPRCADQSSDGFLGILSGGRSWQAPKGDGETYFVYCTHTYPVYWSAYSTPQTHVLGYGQTGEISFTQNVNELMSTTQIPRHSKNSKIFIAHRRRVGFFWICETFLSTAPGRDSWTTTIHDLYYRYGVFHLPTTVYAFRVTDKRRLES